MKRKALTLLFVLVVLFSVSADPYKSPEYEHYMLGFVKRAINLSVRIHEEVLPFDLEGTEVAYNPDYSIKIRGLRIGEYSLVSNEKSFELYVAHSPLVLRGSGEPDDIRPLTTIDYRLYMVIADESFFMSMLSDSNAANPLAASNRIIISGNDPQVWPADGPDILSIVRKSLYVSLEDDTSGDTEQTVEHLKAGIYQSYVYFLIQGP